jgi:hypothetical protein
VTPNHELFVDVIEEFPRKSRMDQTRRRPGKSSWVSWPQSSPSGS